MQIWRFKDNDNDSEAVYHIMSLIGIHVFLTHE